ncbi:major facilitator superfamily domain-containing protein 12-like isoform X2 [Hydractinia symbiolongicarpus]|uniref:major facilitator superfamily domain-containing protein 12-like isoform X2 n=1 Tax=Hydractinia symbiolongicarpus TaxID=13093 RepID=UPI00254E0A0E|nr:major facilitator superfamily domain-containing protein 12-like isoform X2 [Hydractinia symbiolongicarpus]
MNVPTRKIKMSGKKIKKVKFPLQKKLSYGVGHVLNDLCASMWFSYMLLFFHKVAVFNNINSGVLILVGQISDALATPFVGYESDKTTNVRYGRRKIWHLLGVFCVAVSFPFIFSLCIYVGNDASQTARMIYYIPFVIIFQFGWAATQISHLSLIPELTFCEQGKVELNAIRYLFTILSNMLVFAVCFILFEMSSIKNASSSHSYLSSADAPKFQILAICVVVVGLVFMIIFHVGVKEQLIHAYVPACKNEEDDDEEEEALIRNKSVQENEEICQRTIKDWFKVPLFYQVGMLYMMTRLIVNISQVYVSYFVLETLHLEKSSIAIAPAVIYFSGIIASLIAKRLNSKLGLKFTFFFGLILIFGSSTWFYFLRGLSFSNKHQLYGGTVLLGMGGSTLLIDSLAMISEMIGENTDTGAFVYGSMSFLDKLSNGAAIMLIQYFHPCINDPLCCTDCQLYYRTIMTFVPGVAAAIAMMVLLTLGKNAFHSEEDEAEDRDSITRSYGSIDSHPINSSDENDKRGVIRT